MKIVYVTDIHGHIETYERTLKAAEDKPIGAVLIGGDICPGFDPLLQREFMQDYLVPKLAKFQKAQSKPVFIIMGNDDYRENMDILEKADKEGILYFVNQKTAALGNYFVSGYSFINPTPFMIKDWEKSERQIAKDLDKLAPGKDAKRTICLFHAPPYGTLLDVLYDRRHVGSTAITSFIERAKPLLSLHGHIHESSGMSGSFIDRVGDSISLNPGNGNLVLIDLKNPEKAKIL